MRLGPLVFPVILLLGAQNALAEEPALDVRVDPRVELFSVIFRLAGNPEYNQGKVASYVTDVEKHFG